MDLSSLPYETQFRFLLSLPPSDVGSYCNVNSVTAAICRTNAFWNLKSKRDFGITFDMITGDLSHIEKYNLANNKEELLEYLVPDYIPYILSLIRAEAVTNTELVKYNVVATNIIDRIVIQKDDNIAANIIRQVTLSLNIVPDGIGEPGLGQVLPTGSIFGQIVRNLRNAYFYAVLHTMDKTVAVLEKFYDWRFDVTSWTLSQWIKQWHRRNDPVILAKLAKVGLIPANLVQ